MEVKIDRLDHFGRGITKVDDKTCFVDFALDGEVVELEKTKEKKKYSEAKVIKVLKESTDRTASNCPYFPLCGGCDLRYMTKAKQIDFKIKKVKDILIKFGGVDENISLDLVSIDKRYYRNKVVFHVNNRRLGFYKRGSHDLIEIDKCLNVDEKINEVIPIFKRLVQDKDNDINKIMIRVGNITKEVLVSIKGTVKNKELLDVFDVIFINGKSQTKKTSITSIIKDKKFLLSEKDFFQVNEYIVEPLYQEVFNNIKNLNSEKVLDLYCGTGTIGLFVADSVKKVLGIEVVPTSIKAANINKELNNTKNISFLEGKVEDVLKEVNESFDTVIFDPPRSGLDKSIVNTLEKINPQNIIYISCDPVTLARDIKLLSKDYLLKSVKAFDMFPNTYHVESVCLLSRKN